VVEAICESGAFLEGAAEVRLADGPLDVDPGCSTVEKKWVPGPVS
jgi:hypothetical protein